MQEIILEASNEDSDNEENSYFSNIKKEFICFKLKNTHLSNNSFNNINEFEKKASNIYFSYLSCKNNYAGNYDNYVGTTLRHIMSIQALPFEKALSDPNMYINYPFKQIKESLDPNKKLILLDLDETLVHSEYNIENKNINIYDTVIKFKDSSCDSDCYYEVGVFIRNGAQEFLKILSKYFIVGIFTASDKDYADAIIQYLDPNKNVIKFSLYRDNCINMNDMINIKDLRIIKEIDLKKTVLIDNNMYSFTTQLSNGILIDSFYGDKNDVELYNVLNYLLKFILPSDDIREVNEKFFGFKRISQQLE